MPSDAESGTGGAARSGGTWQPVLDGALAERARVAIDDIAAALRADPFPTPGRAGPSPDPAARHGSLALGRVGLALFFANRARARPASGSRSEVRALLNEAVDELDARAGLSLHFGATGIAWTASHLGIPLQTTEGSELVSAIDEQVLAYLSAGRGWETYDLIFGLVGLGVYALERLPDPIATASLSLVIGRLDEMAERGQDGVTWRSVVALMPPRHRKAPTDYFDLGVAHGVPGVVGLLARACAAGVAVERARPLLDGAVARLLRQRLPAGSAAQFPPWAVPGAEPWPADLGWCYGDLGIAAILLQAARAVGEPSWETEALALSHAAAQRSADVSGVKDAQLCHGAAGIAHLFNRMFQATGETWLERAALDWFGRALDLRRPGQKLAGFSAVGRPRAGKARRVAHRGLLHGAAGVGLALLAGTTPVEPAWDRVLLSS